MAIITGYKLICEWCGKKSEELWEISDPEKYLLRRECEDNYLPMLTTGTVTTYYASSKPYDCETEVKKVFLPEDWRSKQLSRRFEDGKWQQSIYKRNIFGKEIHKLEMVPKYTTETKYIYFCCQDHKDSYERLKKNNDEAWK